MKRLVTLVAVAALAVLALGSVTSAQEQVDVALDSLEGFDITGTATLTRTASDYTDVVMIGSGLDPDGGTHINHIHDGTGCGQDEYGSVVATLAPLADNDGDGVMLGPTTVTATDAGDPISFDEITDGNHVLIIHALDGTPAACGLIPVASIAGPAPDKDGAAEKAPAVGSGGFLNQGESAIGFAVLLAGALAVFGLSGLGAAFAVRRIRR